MNGYMELFLRTGEPTFYLLAKEEKPSSPRRGRD